MKWLLLADLAFLVGWALSSATDSCPRADRQLPTYVKSSLRCVIGGQRWETTGLRSVSNGPRLILSASASSDIC